MERVRIRSMLKHLKNVQACMSARSHAVPDCENFPEEPFANIQLDTKICQLNKTHHSFTLEPLESVSKINHQCREINLCQNEKNNFSTFRQKKKTKILNKSFKTVTPIKNMEIEDNLRELGIKKKEINNRNISTADKNKTIEVKVSKYLHDKVPQKPEMIQQLKSFSVQRRKSMPDQQKMVFGEKMSKRNKILLWQKQPLQLQHQKKLRINLPSRFKMRKQSDICPWQGQISYSP